jgi:hypothetical protein
MLLHTFIRSSLHTGALYQSGDAAMKPVDTRRLDYHSYLLRLWRGGSADSWHASLQSTATEQVYYFASIEALFAFLAAQTEDAAPPDMRPAQEPADTHG